MLSACIAGCPLAWVRGDTQSTRQATCTGPHKCVGHKLAMMEAVLCVAALCHRFRFAPLDSPALKMGVTLVPKQGVLLRVSPNDVV